MHSVVLYLVLCLTLLGFYLFILKKEALKQLWSLEIFQMIYAEYATICLLLIIDAFVLCISGVHAHQLKMGEV